ARGKVRAQPVLRFPRSFLRRGNDLVGSAARVPNAETLRRSWQLGPRRWMGVLRRDRLMSPATPAHKLSTRGPWRTDAVEPRDGVFPRKTASKKVRNIPYWVENDVLSRRAVDPGCRPMPGVVCRSASVHSRPAEMRVDSQIQTTRQGP